ncbi:hypothetical protein [Marinomonas sp. TW1]|uniref:hypothetical protein n=1 Tax=Marinomonas sp. TW1 TaxID=1561203 RepID=UPI0007AFB62F|nr:hypothetical protein [Marinomonas sp. TW1]KZN12227.1 hypothetical protein OA79_17340 [Marinomonas sp. TW1]
MMLQLGRITLVGLVSKMVLSPSSVSAEDLGYSMGNSGIEANLQAGHRAYSYQQSTLYYQPSFNIQSSILGRTYGVQGSYGYSLYSPEIATDEAQSQALKIHSFWSPTPSNSFFLNGYIKQEDEQRGTGLTSEPENIDDTLSSFDDRGVHARYVFSQPGQKSLYFSAENAFNKKQYGSDDILALNANLQEESRSFKLGYQWLEDKKIFYQYGKIRQEYPDAIDQSKNTNISISALGLTWPISFISDLSISYGEENKSLDLSRSNLKTNYWNGVLRWSPLPHSQFIFKTSSTQKPTTKLNQTQNKESGYSIEWKHIRSSNHTISLSAQKNSITSTIENIVEKEKKTQLKIKNKYRNYLFSAAYERKEFTSRKDWSLSLSFGYSFERNL